MVPKSLRKGPGKRLSELFKRFTFTLKGERKGFQLEDLKKRKEREGVSFHFLRGGQTFLSDLYFPKHPLTPPTQIPSLGPYPRVAAGRGGGLGRGSGEAVWGLRCRARGAGAPVPEWWQSPQVCGAEAGAHRECRGAKAGPCPTGSRDPCPQEELPTAPRGSCCTSGCLQLAACWCHTRLSGASPRHGACWG